MGLKNILQKNSVKLPILIFAVVACGLLGIGYSLPTMLRFQKNEILMAVIAGIVPAIFWCGISMLALWLILRDFYIKRGKK